MRQTICRGQILKKLGLCESVKAKEAGEQARALIPVAATHTAAMLDLFIRQTGLRERQTNTDQLRGQQGQSA